MANEINKIERQDVSPEKAGVGGSTPSLATSFKGVTDSRDPLFVIISQHNARLRKREFQRKWIARRRAEWFHGHFCIDCGSNLDLQIDHVDPSQKIDHRIWSWSEHRRLRELAKCVVRCESCHVARHAAERTRHGLGQYRLGCRCRICMEFMRLRRRRQKRNRRLRDRAKKVTS